MQGMHSWNDFFFKLQEPYRNQLFNLWNGVEFIVQLKSNIIKLCS